MVKVLEQKWKTLFDSNKLSAATRVGLSFWLTTQYCASPETKKTIIASPTNFLSTFNWKQFASCIYYSKRARQEHIRTNERVSIPCTGIFNCLCVVCSVKTWGFSQCETEKRNAELLQNDNTLSFGVLAPLLLQSAADFPAFPEQIIRVELHEERGPLFDVYEEPIIRHLSLDFSRPFIFMVLQSQTLGSVSVKTVAVFPRGVVHEKPNDLPTRRGTSHIVMFHRSTHGSLHPNCLRKQPSEQVAFLSNACGWDFVTLSAEAKIKFALVSRNKLGSFSLGRQAIQRRSLGI